MNEQILVIDFQSPLMPVVLALRREVFVLEQGIPAELEFDEYDETAVHLVALRNDQVVGTLRIVSFGQVARIGRVAVRAAVRRAGIGSRLMKYAAENVFEKGFREIVLHSEISAAGFYSRLGYIEEGDVFDEVGIPHIKMRKVAV